MTVGAMALPRMAGVSACGLRMSHKLQLSIPYLEKQELFPQLRYQAGAHFKTLRHGVFAREHS